MKISGFTIIRNGIDFEYPFQESIRSLLPLVDELIINAGVGTDQTCEVLERFSNSEGSAKIKLIHSKWPLDDPQKKKSGLILSEQTNLALNQCKGDWCLYLQADEVLHEKDHFLIRRLMKRHLNDPKVEGLLFNYQHFYGSYQVIQQTRSAYRREVRAFKRNSGAMSVGDAQSFRKSDGKKLKVIHSDARIFHYGWVRSPEKMKTKTHFMDQLYHGENHGDKPHSGGNYRYKKFWGLKQYNGSHPRFMKKRIAEKDWNWDLENSEIAWEIKDIKKIFSDLFERWTGIRLFEYQSYQIISEPPLKTDQDYPVASVILTTFDHPRPLEWILYSLANQSFQNFELILCDDGSGHETRNMVNEFKNLAPFHLEYLWQENKGFRKCKILNEALRRSKGQILIFLDGDCVPSRHFVKDHLDFFSESTYSAGRRVELGEKISNSLSLQDVKKGFFNRPRLKLFLDVLFGTSNFFHRTIRLTTPWIRKILKLNRVLDMKGCNYSVSRDALIEINGFDEDYEGYGREDTDVELRLQNLGLKIKSLKNIACQYHVWHPRLDFTPKNEDRLDALKNSDRYRCHNGLQTVARPIP